MRHQRQRDALATAVIGLDVKRKIPETIQLAEFSFQFYIYIYIYIYIFFFFFSFKIAQILKTQDWFQPVAVKSSRRVVTWV